MSKAIRHSNLNSKDALVARANFLRLDASRRLAPDQRAVLGQFFTPPAVARLMASMFAAHHSSVRLLDASAGVGSLSSAFIARALNWRNPPKEISVTAYEVDQNLAEYLVATFGACQAECARANTSFTAELFTEDFVEAGVQMLSGKLVSPRQHQFNYAILNPPYRKINSESATRLLLRTVGIETSNLYTAFLSIVMRLLEPGGELVAITP
jgi:adenine-specific DNA-methyltransferase